MKSRGKGGAKLLVPALSALLAFVGVVFLFQKSIHTEKEHEDMDLRFSKLQGFNRTVERLQHHLNEANAIDSYHRYLKRMELEDTDEALITYLQQTAGLSSESGNRQTTIVGFSSTLDKELSQVTPDGLLGTSTWNIIRGLVADYQERELNNPEFRDDPKQVITPKQIDEALHWIINKGEGSNTPLGADRRILNDTLTFLFQFLHETVGFPDEDRLGRGIGIENRTYQETSICKAVKLYQKKYNKNHKSTFLVEDGGMGPNTILAISRGK